MNEKWSPRDYQIEALNFLLSNKKGALFLDPGLGKTSISLSAIKILTQSSHVDGTLIIAPLQVVYNVWPQEIKKWSNFKNITFLILHGDFKCQLWMKKRNIYLINPEGLPWLHDELLKGLKIGKKCPFNCLWVDESTKFKSHKAKRFELLCNMLPLFKQRYIMSGTPAPKNLLDLWSQLFIIDNGNSLGDNYYKFKNSHFKTDDWNKYLYNMIPGAEKKIHNAIGSITLDMKAEDYLDIPAITHNYTYVELSPKSFKQYKKMEKEFFIELDIADVSAEATAQALMKCHQIANGNVYESFPEGLSDKEKRQFAKTRKTVFIHDEKTIALSNLIDELNGKPLLVSYRYGHDLKALQKEFGKKIPVLGKGVAPSIKGEIIKKWNNKEIPLLFCQPDSVAHGLNMQKGGHDICWFSLTWNLENYIQFNKRLHRSGVKKKVRIHHLVAKHTIDEAMVERLGERAKIQQDMRSALREYRYSL